MPFEVEHQIDIPIGTLLRAQLKSLEVRTVPYTDRKTGEQTSFDKLNWVFEITQQGDYFGKTVRAETSAYLSDSPENRFRNWSEALLGRPLGQGMILNESDLIGLSALITVKYENDRNDASKKWRRVDDVISLAGDFAGNDEPPF